MEKVKSMLKPKVEPQKQLREWQRRLRRECLNIDRQFILRHLSKSAEVMKIVNYLVKAPEISATMQKFSKEMTKARVREEIVNEAVDSALDSEDEPEEEIYKVLIAIAGETAAQLAEGVRKERVKQPARAEDA